MRFPISLLAALLALALISLVGARDTYAAGTILDLDTTDPGVTIYGRQHITFGLKADFFGFGVSHGHFDDDHHEDLVITAPRADGPGTGTACGNGQVGNRCQAGEAYVILGSHDLGTDPTADIVDTFYGRQSYTIFGPSTGAFLGEDFSTLSHGSDINGDGLDDIVVGSNRTNRAYVILGSSTLGDEDGVAGGCGDGNDNGGGDGADVNDSDCYHDLAVNSAHLTITGKPGDELGRGVVSRDINLDGYSDVVVGAQKSDGPDGTRSDAGAVYVIFGSSTVGQEDGVLNGCGDGVDNGAGDGADLNDSDCHKDLSTTPANVTIYGADSGDMLARTIDVRNINGTGLPGSEPGNDIVLGAMFADGPNNSRPDTGEVYLLSRTSWPATIDLALGQQSYTVYGEDPGDQLGISVYTGDVNGDGFADTLAGSNGEDGPGNGTGCGTGQVGDLCNAGGARLIYGSANLGKEDGVANGCGDGIDNGGGDGADPADTDCYLDLATGTPNLTIYGSAPGGANGSGAVHLAALTDDRFDDILVGQNIADIIANAGKTFVIRGSPSLSGTRDLADANDFDFVVWGDRPAVYAPGDYSGWWPIGADFNGDGFSELITSAFLADGPNETRANAGEVYIIFDPDLDGSHNGIDDDDDNDTVPDTEDNCDLVANAGQGDWNANGIGDACDDADGDSIGFRDGPVSPYFRDSIEVLLGTSPSQNCANTTTPNDEADDKWPPDFNDDRIVNIKDISAFAAHYPSPPDPYDSRFDLNADGVINDPDLNILLHYLNRTCPP